MFLTTEAAAKLMGISSQTVRRYMETNVLDLGDVIDPRPGSKTRRYLIHSEKVAEYVGMSNREVIDEYKNIKTKAKKRK